MQHNETAKASSMTRPTIVGIDHVHIYVKNHAQAAEWYTEVLGYAPCDSQSLPVPDGAPLMLSDSSNTVNLAVFERNSPQTGSALAFGTTGEDFLKWVTYLNDKAITLRLADHTTSVSMYFSDPDNNLHEITSHQRDFVVSRLEF